MKKITAYFLLILIGIFLGIRFGKFLFLRSFAMPNTISYANNQKVTENTLEITPQIVNKFVTNVIKNPKLLTIPSLDIQADVKSIGLDSEGNMDVPKITSNVAWYNLGFKPGENGSAVIAGHLDDTSGQPAVFYNLSQLKYGDLIEVTDEDNQIYRFSVTKIETYPYDDLPMQEIFASVGQPQLNLITCKGNFDRVEQNYSHRVVVYSTIALKN